MPSTKLLLVGGAAALILAAPPPARAAEAVFGGSTRAGEPIVLKTDAKATALSSAVIGWEAKCDDGGFYPGSTELAAAETTPGFSPGFRDLLMSRNGKGRFAGTQLAGGSGDTTASAIVVELAGKLAPKRASGTLNATVKIMDKATGAAVASCTTGKLSWSAAREPGVVYGGRSSEEEPVVVRVDAKRRRVTDLLASWRTSTCTPPSMYRYPERLGGFPLASTGRFGDSWGEDYPMDGGGKRHFAYQLAGRVTSKAVKGTLRVTIADADPAGAQTLSCDSGGVTFKAVSG
jgi:hypothetical protein